MVMTANSKNQISYSLTENGVAENRNFFSSYNFTEGSGSGQVDFAVTLTGLLGSGAKFDIDLRNIPITTAGVSSGVFFDVLKGIAVHNTSEGYGQDLNIHATGVQPYGTGLFNGGSGNLIIKPFSSYQWSDPLGGINIPPATGHSPVEAQIGFQDLTLANNGTENVSWATTLIGTASSRKYDSIQLDLQNVYTKRAISHDLGTGNFDIEFFVTTSNKLRLIAFGDYEPPQASTTSTPHKVYLHSAGTWYLPAGWSGSNEGPNEYKNKYVTISKREDIYSFSSEGTTWMSGGISPSLTSHYINVGGYTSGGFIDQIRYRYVGEDWQRVNWDHPKTSKAIITPV